MPTPLWLEKIAAKVVNDIFLEPDSKQIYDWLDDGGALAPWEI